MDGLTDGLGMIVWFKEAKILNFLGTFSAMMRKRLPKHVMSRVM